MDKGATHFTQHDERWRELPVFSPNLSASLQKLTDEVHRITQGDPRATIARSALLDFTTAARKAIRHPAAAHSSRDGTIYDYGCQICSIATMMRLFDVRLGRKPATPKLVLEKMRDECLVTLTGFSWEVGVDPVGVITSGKIRLVGYEDTLGVLPSRCKRLTSIPRNRIALLNVIGHEYLRRGRSDTSHYIIVKGGQRKTRSKLIALDPSADLPIQLEAYKRVFVVRLYEKRK